MDALWPAPTRMMRASGWNELDPFRVEGLRRQSGGGTADAGSPPATNSGTFRARRKHCSQRQCHTSLPG